MRTASTGTPARVLAFGIGTIGAAGALYTLLEHPIKTGAWSWDYALPVLVLMIAIGAGKMQYLAWRSGVRQSALAFWVLFVAATVWVVVTSVKNQAVSRDDATAAVVAANAGVALLTAKRSRVQQRYDDAEREFALQLSGGQTSAGRVVLRCRSAHIRRDCPTAYGWKLAMEERQARLDALDAELAATGPARAADPGLVFWGDVAAFMGWPRGQVEAGLRLFVPILQTLIFELTSIWGFGFAFYGMQQRLSTVAATVVPTKSTSWLGGATVAELEEVRQLLRAPLPDPVDCDPQPPGARQPLRAGYSAELHPLDQRRALRLVANNPGVCVSELASQLDVHKGTVSRWWQRCAAVRGERDGRFVRLYQAA